MPIKHLDKSRDFGQFYPPDNGAFYQQDGFRFSHDGTLLPGQLAAVDAPPKPKKVGRPSASKTQAAAEPETAPPPPEPATPPQPGDPLNLELWLRGAATYPDKDVRQAVRERYNKWMTQVPPIVEFLVDEEKLVAMDDLAPRFKAMLKSEAA